MKHLLVFSIIVCFTKGSAAQFNTALPYKDRWVVRFSPLGLADVFDGNITVGTAYAIKDRLTLTADISYIFYSAYIQNNKGVGGYIMKPGIRYYLSDKRKFFVESAVFYKRVDYKINDWLGKDYVNGVPAYTELATFTFRKRVVGLNIQAGVQKSLIRNDLLRIEIYGGLNIRYKWQDVKNDSQARYQPNDILNESIYTPHAFSAGIPHGLRLVYVLR